MICNEIEIEIAILNILVVCDRAVMLGPVYGYHWSLITFYSASCCRENALFKQDLLDYFEVYCCLVL